MKYGYIILLLLLVRNPGRSQHYESDSVLVRRIWDLVEVPDEEYGGSSIVLRESDDKGVVDSTDKWEIDRNGDFIQIKHWLGDGTGLLYSIVVQNETESYFDTLSDGTHVVNSLLTAIASDGGKRFPLTINWQYVDIDRDGMIDQFRFHWMEPKAYHKRIIYCHLQE